jgi:nitroreductase
MDLEQALRTTGAVREFSDRPVPESLVHHLLDVARFAPSGGNRQAWRVIMIKDHASRERLRDLYLHGWYEYLAMSRAGLVPWAPVTDRDAEAEAVAHAAEVAAGAGARPGMAERLDQVPVLLALVADLRSLAAVDRDLERYTLIGGASVYPFAWSILLAAHDVGLGGVMTTMLVREERTVLDLLGVPEGYVLAGAIVLGYPNVPPPTRLARTDVGDFATIDRFDGPPVTGA